MSEGSKVGRPLNGADRTHMTYAEFAELIGTTHGTVKRWVHEGMPVLRSPSGGWPRIPIADALSWLDEKPRPPSGTIERVVYFARIDDDRIKIGMTNDVERRVVELRRRFGAAELLTTIPGDKRTELAMHQRFDHLALGDELFASASELVEFVRVLSGNERAA